MSQIKLVKLRFVFTSILFSVSDPDDFFYSNPQTNARWKAIAETEAYFETKDQTYWKNYFEELKYINKRCIANDYKYNVIYKGICLKNVIFLKVMNFLASWLYISNSIVYKL